MRRNDFLNAESLSIFSLAGNNPAYEAGGLEFNPGIRILLYLFLLIYLFNR